MDDTKNKKKAAEWSFYVHTKMSELKANTFSNYRVYQYV